MTPQDLDALEKLADEATPGEWKPTPGHPSGRFHGIHTDDGPVVRFGGMGKVSTAGHANAAFIAAANPATIKALIAELREAKGLLSESADLTGLCTTPDRFSECGTGEVFLRMTAHNAKARAFLARNGKGEGG